MWVFYDVAGSYKRRSYKCLHISDFIKFLRIVVKLFGMLAMLISNIFIPYTTMSDSHCTLFWSYLMTVNRKVNVVDAFHPSAWNYLSLVLVNLSVMELVPSTSTHNKTLTIFTPASHFPARVAIFNPNKAKIPKSARRFLSNSIKDRHESFGGLTVAPDLHIPLLFHLCSPLMGTQLHCAESICMQMIQSCFSSLVPGGERLVMMRNRRWPDIQRLPGKMSMLHEGVLVV